MANDKDFIVKNAVEVGGPTNVTLGTVTSNNIDLATGNYFKDTPIGTSTYSISNAGDVQSFQLEVTGGLEAVASSFSTTLYTGVQLDDTDIVTGVDLANDGGLVWIKDRSTSYPHYLYDTERGVTKQISSSQTNGEGADLDSVTAFNSNGFTIGNDIELNTNNNTYVAWSFKKQTKFFDVVTYTGNGTAGRTVSHSLGSVPGMIIVKKTSAAGDYWNVFHRGIGETKALYLNATDAQATGSGFWNNTAPTNTDFSVGASGEVNGNGATFVAYLFAHDTAADSMIKCGSYTGGGETDVAVTLGWKPQWLLVRRSDAAEDWFILDTARGLGADGDRNAILKPNLTDAETSSSTRVAVTDTGFFTTANTGSFNASGGTYIYVAIRAASDLDITWPSSIEFAGGVAPAAPATGETDVFTFSTDDGGTSYIGTKTADNLS